MIQEEHKLIRLSIFDQVKYMTIFNFYEEKRRRREGLECEKKCKN